MRFLPFLTLLILGLAAGYFLAPFEQEAVRNYLIGFPNADEELHNLRPWAVYGLALVPALGALWYGFASILDRYLFRIGHVFPLKYVAQIYLALYICTEKS